MENLPTRFKVIPPTSTLIEIWGNLVALCGQVAPRPSPRHHGALFILLQARTRLGSGIKSITYSRHGFIVIWCCQWYQIDQYIYGFWDIVLGYVVPIVVTILFWLRFMGTPGKMALKLRVVDARTGNKLSLGQAIGRYFAYILSMLPFGLGFIWIGIDSRKQGWHDKLAGTVVIRDTTPVPVRFDS